MAQFSQGFLSSLGRPEMSQSLFGLGAAIGGVPGQIKQRQKEQAFNQLMQQVQAAQGSGDFASMKALSQQMAQTNPQQAAQIMQAAIAGEEKQKIAQEQIQGTRAGAQVLMSELQDYATDETIPEALRRQSGNFLRAAATAGDRASLLEPRVAELRELITESRKPKEPIILTPGATRIDPETNEVLARGAFKPTPSKYNVLQGSKGDHNIYVFTDGKLTDTIEPAEKEGESLKEREQRTAAIIQVVRSRADIRKLAGPDFMASGFTGNISAQFLAGTDAYDRRRAIESLRSTLGLEQIANLKRLSSTGSTGLGQVSNLELNALQSEVASLDVGMSEEAQIRALTKIHNHLETVQKALSGVGSEDMVNWNSKDYLLAGYSKDKQSGIVFYAPEGKEGPVYKMVDGKFVKADI